MCDGRWRFACERRTIESGIGITRSSSSSAFAAGGTGGGPWQESQSGVGVRAIAGGVGGTGGGAGAAGAGAGKGGGACSWQSHSTLSYSNCRVVQLAHTMRRVGHELHGLIVSDGASQCAQARTGAAETGMGGTAVWTGAAGSGGVLIQLNRCVLEKMTDGWNPDLTE